MGLSTFLLPRDRRKDNRRDPFAWPLRVTEREREIERERERRRESERTRPLWPMMGPHDDEIT